jgi:hypothetical protein
MKEYKLVRLNSLEETGDILTAVKKKLNSLSEDGWNIKNIKYFNKGRHGGSSELDGTEEEFIIIGDKDKV